MTPEETNFLRSCTPDEESFKKLQQYLKKEKRFRHLSDMSIDGVIISQNAVIVDANSAVSAIYGYTFDEIRGKTLFDFTTPESSKIALHKMQNGFTGTYELTAVHKDGYTFPIEVVGKNLEYDGDKYRITIVRDITERKQQEQKLRSLQANTLALIENTDDSIWSVDREYRLITFNSAFSKSFFDGFGIRLTVGAHASDLVPEEVFYYWKALYDRALKGEKFSVENKFEMPGILMYSEISLNPIITDGEITGVAAYSRDITERKRSEEAFKNSQSNLTAIFENTDAAIWSVDPEFRLLTFNSAYDEVFFKTFGQRLQTGASLVDLVPEATATMWRPMYERAFTGERFSFEFTVVLNGEERFREVALNPIYSGEIITSVTAFGRDVTERKINEEALKSSLEKISALIENTTDSIWSVDREYCLTAFNSVYEQFFLKRFGKNLKIGLALHEAVPEGIYTHLVENYERAFKGEQFSFEYDVEFNGKTRNREISLNPIVSGDIITGVVAFGRDITGRKQSEEVLKKSQAAIRGLIENTKDSIWSIDRDYCLLTYNSVFEQHFFKENGIYPAIGISLKEIIPAQTLQYWLPVYYRALNGEHFTVENETGDVGELCYTEVTLNPFITDGEITGVAAFSRDISERKRSEQALKVSKANITDVIENTSDLIWSFDRDFKIITFNTNYAHYLEHAYGVNTVSGMEVFKIGSALENDYWKNKYSRALNGEKYSFDIKYEAEGKKHYVELSLNPIITEGTVTGVVAFGRDITERKQNEFALRKSQSNIMALIENTTASFWSVDRSCRLLTLNTVFAANHFNEYGIRLKVGDANLEAMPAEMASYWESLYERCFEGEHIIFDRHSGKSSSTELYYQETSLHPIITDGVITGAACSSRDITDRKRTEERLREHSALLDIANEAVIVRDLNTRVTFWNKAAERMYGWTGRESIGRSINDLIYNKDTTERFKEAWDELLFSGQWSGELIEQNRNGKEVISYCRWTLVFDSNGKPKSVLAINNDITEQKSLQEQFYRSQRMESLGTLASGIAHDLNNVLTPILLSVEILRLKYPEEKNSRMLETIEVSAQRGSDIVRQVLMFASGVGGERKLLSLADSIREIAMIIRKTFSKSIEVLVSISDSASPILGDATQIQQILMNLCVNARDAMPQGGEICIELEGRVPTHEIFSTTPEAKSLEYTVLAITDSGKGIPPEILDKIFDPFFTTKEKGSGTGLGLSTVNAIVKSHNGFMKVFNNINKDKGATFEIWLPASHGKQHNAITQEPATVLTGQRKTILIVDDEPLILQLISYALENFGFTILTANNGAEALLVFKENPQIELVITDVNMPLVDGPALIAELIKLKQSLKFIIMTGLPINTRMDEMKAVGVSSFLSKPFKTQILLKAIENAFNPEVAIPAM
ncbi:MAG: PAS domain S-box protein [Bacteroidota bacterium]